MSKFAITVKADLKSWGDPRFIMVDVSNALKKAGATRAEIDQFLTEAMSGDADNVLRTAHKWVQVA